jgi:acetylornithine deacetylase/succinyl-diaminopimelate desuccinylase-like protein
MRSRLLRGRDRVSKPLLLLAHIDVVEAKREDTYGLSGMFHDAEKSHAHGLNERIRVESLMNGRRFLYEVVKLYANSAD